MGKTQRVLLLNEMLRLDSLNDDDLKRARKDQEGGKRLDGGVKYQFSD